MLEKSCDSVKVTSTLNGFVRFGALARNSKYPNLRPDIQNEKDLLFSFSESCSKAGTLNTEISSSFLFYNDLTVRLFNPVP